MHSTIFTCSVNLIQWREGPILILEPAGLCYSGPAYLEVLPVTGLLNLKNVMNWALSHIP
jgi:hypothetical protein